MIELVRASIPGVRCEQLKVSHPGADDDGLWYFEIPGMKGNVQAESSTGMCPFMIEADYRDMVICRTVEDSARMVVAWLNAPMTESP